MLTLNRLKTIIEIDKHLSTLIKTFLIFCSPPVFLISIIVKLTTLIIESMAHLMTYDGTYSTIIVSIISIYVKERRLKNSSREVDGIIIWLVIGVDGLW